MFRYVIFFILLLLPPLPFGVLMVLSSHIFPSSSFAGSYDLRTLRSVSVKVLPGDTHERHGHSTYPGLSRDVTPCHNLPTAKAIRDGRGADPVTVTPRNTEESFGCFVGGAGYDAAVTWVLTGRVERCHNWATANTIARNHPPAVTPDVSGDCGVSVTA